VAQVVSAPLEYHCRFLQLLFLSLFLPVSQCPPRRLHLHSLFLLSHGQRAPPSRCPDSSKICRERSCECIPERRISSVFGLRRGSPTNPVSTRVATFLQNPFDHLSFSQSCAAARRAYTPRLYRRLCHVYGFGRPNTLKNSASWCRHFEAVIRHFRNCSEYGCRHYGVLGEMATPLAVQAGRTDARKAPGTSGAILRSIDDIKALVDRGGK
jgi:hypothetical protein